MKHKLKELGAKLKPKRGSILVYTLIIMMIILATALSIAAVTVREKKGAGTTAASTQAFAVADSGSEVALNAIFKNPGSSIGEIYSCTDGIATIPDLVGGSVQLTFYSDEESANIIPCNGPELLGDARKVKSVGRYGGTARAVEVAVAGSGTWDDCEFKQNTGNSKSSSVACSTGYHVILGGCSGNWPPTASYPNGEGWACGATGISEGKVTAYVKCCK